MGANNVKSSNNRNAKSKSLLRLTTSLNRSHCYSSSAKLSSNCNNLIQDLDIYFIRQIARSLRVSFIIFILFFELSDFKIKSFLSFNNFFLISLLTSFHFFLILLQSVNGSNSWSLFVITSKFFFNEIEFMSELMFEVFV